MKSRKRACKALVLALTACLVCTGAPGLALAQDDRATLDDKPDVPTLSKEVRGVTSADWSDVATFGTGVSLSYRITFRVPQNFGEYATYECAIHDTLVERLTLDKDSIKVMLVHSGETVGTSTQARYSTQALDSAYADEETDISAQAIITTTATSLSVAFMNLCETQAQAGDCLVITYEASADCGQASGSAGLASAAYATYPGYSGTGETVADTTTVYSFGLYVEKTNADGEILQGAVFALQNAEGLWLAQDGTWAGEEGRATFATDEDGLISDIPSLDQGNYTLTELFAPAGYALADDPDIPIVIEADLMGAANGGIELSASATGAGSVTSIDASECTFTVSVVNVATGETGGIVAGTSAAGGISSPSSAYPKTGQTLAGIVVPMVGLCFFVLAIVVHRRRVRASCKGGDAMG